MVLANAESESMATLVMPMIHSEDLIENRVIADTSNNLYVVSPRVRDAKHSSSVQAMGIISDAEQTSAIKRVLCEAPFSGRIAVRPRKWTSPGPPQQLLGWQAAIK